ncbi:MAG: hypothetical protein AB9917_15145 [Negativicutes bacterium]
MGQSFSGKIFYWCVLISVLVLFSAQEISAASAVNAAAFTPQPGLRIWATGILGSDGIRFEKTLVTARLNDEQFVTEAEVDLAYAEWRKPMVSVPENREVWRYSSDETGIVKTPLLAKRGYKKYFWLSANVGMGRQWKAPWGYRREIIANNVTVETPAGRFEDCILVEYDVYAGGTGIERHYIAPGVGLIQIVSFSPKASKGIVWYEVQRIETIPQHEARQIVSRLLGL